MPQVKPIKILWVAAMIFLAAVNKGYSQVIWNPNHQVGTVTGKYNFAYNQTPDQLVEIYSAAIFIPGGAGYQWMQSPTPVVTDFTSIGGATGASYSFTAPLTQDMYFMRKTYSVSNPANFVYSNIIKISVVSINWEDINYIRHHDLLVNGVTDWQTVDQMPVGQKLQTTIYMDGLGRNTETISRETATPASLGNTWGDVVQFNTYDQATGRQFVKYLPYTTVSQSGKYKTATLTEQPQYYTTVFNETSAYSSVTYDNSPLNRVTTVNEAGGAWAGAPGNRADYDVNDANENVQIFAVDYLQGDAPVNHGPYPANTLYKKTFMDEANNKVIEYTDKQGLKVLKKVQSDPSPGIAHTGWICTYYVYDDLGLLRYQIQPEGVKYLDANGWSFAGANGAAVLAEQCFQYNYDDRGRTIWKKNPGAAPLTTIYDSRDRPVFIQDGNQNAKSPGEWTATLYDDLDRITLTTLYETSETPAALQADINNAITTSTYNTFTATPNPTTTLDIYTRQNNTPAVYSASQSITFHNDQNFTSGTNDQFVAEIDPLIVSTNPTTVTTFSLGNPISQASLSNPSVTTILSYYFYDDYSFATARPFNTNFTNLTVYSPSDPSVLPITQTARTTGMPTGSLSRVLGTNNFLGSTVYYDEKGRATQTLEDNIKGGVDITTVQHYFDGRVLSNCNDHTAPGTGYTNFVTLTKYLFDKLGRVSSVQKQYGSNPMKTVVTYDVDDLGRMKTKHLDPNYQNPNSGQPDLESLNYTFNIHEQLTGINKDYALKTAGTYNKWGHFFGVYLGYDNSDHVFNLPMLNGQITGQMWNTQGDDAQRKYDYTYDPDGRLTSAAYNEQQHPGDGWSTTATDFTVSGFSGKITYDLNGNLLSMLQKGVVPGLSAPVTMDDLRYAYKSFSNQLQSVTDQMTTPSSNGTLGDFKDGTNAAGTPDYVYDANGNLLLDLNKNVQSVNNGAAGTSGITYNFLDKPDQIRVVGKGTIKIVYDASGEKLQKVFIPESGGNATITTYISEFTYTESAPLTLSSPAPFSGTGAALSFISFEEGRVRVMTPVSQGNSLDGLTESGNLTLPNGQAGVWDYFIMDQQKNIRMILTEETHSVVNTCTMETSNNRAAQEDPIFGQQGAGNEVETTRYPTPAGWQSSNSTAYVTRLGNNAGHNIGPNVLQKVMAGDQITTSVQYYYQGAITNSNPNIVANILNSLTAAIGGGTTAGTIVHNNAANIGSQLGGTPSFITAVEPTGAGGTTPQAFLTILFFDERFHLIASQDGGVVQQQVASSWSASNSLLALGGVKAPKNGYAYVYVSNRSDQDVYFDNLTVGITAGNIIEEDHYYAFGQKIAGISSKKIGDAGEGSALKNNYLYNDQELIDDGDLNWLDYGFRQYDPQIGRFVASDPLADYYSVSSPYLYAYNNPISNVDVDGLFGGGIATTAETAKTLTEVVVVGYRAAKTTIEIGQFALGFTRIVIQSASVAATVINTGLPTGQVGSIKDLQPGRGWAIENGKMWKMALINGEIIEAFYAKDMKISQEAYKAIKELEQLGKKKDNIYVNNQVVITCPYDDDTHNATIGYGHLIDRAPYNRNKPSHLKWDNGLTPEQAEDLLKKDIEELGAADIRRDITTPITQSEFDALVIAKFNGGYGETLRNLVNSSNYSVTSVFNAFIERSKATDAKTKKKVTMKGLVIRRAVEATIFCFNIFNPFKEKDRNAFAAKFMPKAEKVKPVPKAKLKKK